MDGRTARGGTGHLGLTHTETQRGRLWTACGQRRVDSQNSQTTPATTSTSSIRQLLGAVDAQTAHHATFSTAPTHQLLGSRTRKRYQQEHRPQRPTESSNPTQHAKGRTGDCPGPCKGAITRRNVMGGVKIFFAYCDRCASIQTQILHNFFLAHGPPNQWRGPWVRTLGTPGRPPYGSLL